MTSKNKIERQRAIYYRCAVVCFALAAGLGFLWFGLAAGFQEAIPWAICITVAGCVIFWPSEPMPRKERKDEIPKHD